ncbi:MAG: zf-HC2 domain-containing protein [Acidobacteriota bacterium]
MSVVINCRDFDGFLHDYFEGDLPWLAATTFKLHMMMCRKCRGYLRSYRTAMEVGKTVLGEPDDPVSEEVPDRLVQAVLAAKRASEG